MRFTMALGEDWPKEDILLLTESHVDYHDLEKLIENECPKDLAMQILF